MVRLAMFNRSLREACPRIFSLLFLLVVLVSPLLEPLPVYADWGADTRLTNDPADSILTVMVTSGNNLHVVWNDNRDGHWEIYYKRSTDGGTTWGADTRLTTDSADSQFAVPGVSANNVHVVWEDKRDGSSQIYYKHSIDNGTTWGADIRLSSGASGSHFPIIVVSGNNLHVVWDDTRDGTPQIYYKRSIDNGTTWGDDTRLSTGTIYSVNPVVAVSGNNVDVVWADLRDAFGSGSFDGNAEIYYKHSTDGGITWSPDIRLSNGIQTSFYPVVAISGNNVHVTWDDNRDGNYEIYYKRSIDGGITWGADTRQTFASGTSFKPVVTVSGDDVHIIWNDNRDGNYAIYYKHSADGGITWGPDTKLSSGTANSLYPVGNDRHAVWHDERDGNYEIYYKRCTVLPAVNSINPSRGTVGQTLDNVIIKGAIFTGGAVVSLGAGVVINSVRVVSDTLISVNITITPGAISGVRDVSVTTPGGTATLAKSFKVVEQNSLIGTGAATPHGSSAATSATSTAPVSISNIQTQSARLSAGTVTSGTPVTVTADIANKGTVNGSKKVTLYINGEVESTQGVMVNSGGCSELTFSVLRNEPGEYEVYVDGVPAGSFKVELFKESDVILIFSSVLLAIAFVMGIVMLRRRQQYGN